MYTCIAKHYMETCVSNGFTDPLGIYTYAVIVGIGACPVGLEFGQGPGVLASITKVTNLRNSSRDFVQHRSTADIA